MLGTEVPVAGSVEGTVEDAPGIEVARSGSRGETILGTLGRPPVVPGTLVCAKRLLLPKLGRPVLGTKLGTATGVAGLGSVACAGIAEPAVGGRGLSSRCRSGCCPLFISQKALNLSRTKYS